MVIVHEGYALCKWNGLLQTVSLNVDVMSDMKALWSPNVVTNRSPSVEVAPTDLATSVAWQAVPRRELASAGYKAVLS